MNKQEPLLVDKVYIDIGCFERGCACASSNAQAGEDAECVAVVKHKDWVGLTWNDVPDEWVGKVAFMEGAKWADKQLKGKNT